MTDEARRFEAALLAIEARLVRGQVDAAGYRAAVHAAIRGRLGKAEPAGAGDDDAKTEAA